MKVQTLPKGPKKTKKPKRPIAKLGRRGKVKADALRAIRQKYPNVRCQWENGGVPCFQVVDLHHKILRSQGGKDVPSNLVGLCRFHHSQAHMDHVLLTVIRQSQANIINGGWI
jgi:hypothetical protein